MKTIKIIMFGFSLIASSCFLFLNRAHAVTQPNGRQINNQTCYDKDGNVTGYGNSCVVSQNYNCLSNSCQ